MRPAEGLRKYPYLGRSRFNVGSQPSYWAVIQRGHRRGRGRSDSRPVSREKNVGWPIHGIVDGSRPPHSLQ